MAPSLFRCYSEGRRLRDPELLRDLLVFDSFRSHGPDTKNIGAGQLSHGIEFASSITQLSDGASSSAVTMLQPVTSPTEPHDVLWAVVQAIAVAMVALRTLIERRVTALTRRWRKRMQAMAPRVLGADSQQGIISLYPVMTFNVAGLGAMVIRLRRYFCRAPTSAYRHTINNSTSEAVA